LGIPGQQGEWALLEAGVVTSRSAISATQTPRPLTPRDFGIADFGRVAGCRRRTHP